MVIFANITQNKVDNVFLFVHGICVALLAVVTVAMIYFVIKYSRKKNPKPVDIPGNLWLEITWTVVPVILVTLMFLYGLSGFNVLRKVPADAMLVKASARMWQWNFQYENGRRSEILYVPSGKPVKLAITSADVVHSLFIPAFRVKEDAVPGRETYLWFQGDDEGSYDLFCAEYCGVQHSAMLTKVVVMSADKFDGWYSSDGAVPSPPQDLPGHDLFIAKGCSTCHSESGQGDVTSPVLKKLFGSKITTVRNGAEVELIVDEDYLRRSIIDPDADVRKGFLAVMPSYKDALTEDELRSIVNYLEKY
ncbi:MAG: cytochrome c oxidase subunit II [Planctomycetes bacterium]|nr:cytochrome c oxidase subunit II [Planctomycetota bacterium]